MPWQILFDNINFAHSKITEKHPITATVDGVRVCIGKHQNQFYAIEDTCPHQDASLGKGVKLPSGGVQCPFHHYVFDIRTGECLIGGCRDLKTFKIEEKNGKVMIEI